MLDTISGWLINNAYADNAAVAAPQAPAGSNFSLILMLSVFIFFIYFTVWRPQSKRAKEQRELFNSLAVNDEVLTTGGILGKIVKLGTTYVVLAVADKVEITIQKSSIANALPKGTMGSI